MFLILLNSIGFNTFFSTMTCQCKIYIDYQNYQNFSVQKSVVFKFLKKKFLNTCLGDLLFVRYFFYVDYICNTYTIGPIAIQNSYGHKRVVVRRSLCIQKAFFKAAKKRLKTHPNDQLFNNLFKILIHRFTGLNSSEIQQQKKEV